MLAGGGKAGRFSPSACHVPADVAGWQRDLIYQCQAEIAALAVAVEPWTEMNLNCCQLPHPLLGKLTVKEMLFFTLYHYEYHRAIVAGRLGTSGQSTLSISQRIGLA